MLCLFMAGLLLHVLVYLTTGKFWVMDKLIALTDRWDAMNK